MNWRFLPLLLLLLVFGYPRWLAFRSSGWLPFEFAEFVLLIFQTEATLLIGWWGLSRRGWLFRLTTLTLGFWFLAITAFRVASRLPLFDTVAAAAWIAGGTIASHAALAAGWFLWYRWRGLRLSWKTLDGALSRVGRRQFDLRQLLVFMALASLLLALTRSTLTSQTRWGAGWQVADSDSITLVAIFAAFGGLLNPPFLFGIFRPSLWTLCLVPYWVFISIAQSAVFGALYHDLGVDATWRDVLWSIADNGLWNLAQLLPLLGAGLLLRFAGLRLE